MFARNVSFHLKSNMLSDYTRTFDKDILPLLRRQNGFKDEITFSGPGGIDVTAISLWENKASSDTYNTNTYPEVLKTRQDSSRARPRCRPAKWSTRPSIRSRLELQRKRLYAFREGGADAPHSRFLVGPADLVFDSA